MGRNQYSYPPEYRSRMVELVRAGRTPEELEWRFNNRNNSNIFQDTIKRIVPER